MAYKCPQTPLVREDYIFIEQFPFSTNLHAFSAYLLHVVEKRGDLQSVHACGWVEESLIKRGRKEQNKEELCQADVLNKTLNCQDQRAAPHRWSLQTQGTRIREGESIRGVWLLHPHFHQPTETTEAFSWRRLCRRSELHPWQPD